MLLKWLQQALVKVPHHWQQCCECPVSVVGEWLQQAVVGVPHHWQQFCWNDYTSCTTGSCGNSTSLTVVLLKWQQQAIVGVDVGIPHHWQQCCWNDYNRQLWEYHITDSSVVEMTTTGNCGSRCGNTTSLTVVLLKWLQQAVVGVDVGIPHHWE